MVRAACIAARRVVAGAALAALATAVGAQGLSPQARAGQEKSRSCMVCHGQVGVSNQPHVPHLAGQPAIYVAEQLKAYRTGRRANEIMSVIAKPLTDDDIASLAAWYASIRIDATAPD
jgi:cytochrome c553